MSAETALEVGMVCGKGESGIGTAEVKANVCVRADCEADLFVSNHAR